MRLQHLLSAAAAAALAPLALAAHAADWAAQAARAKDGVLVLNSQSYDELVAAPSRDYSVTIVLTALPAQFRCAPCKEFDPVFRTVARSWRRNAPADDRDTHFFAVLDFADGQAIYQRLGLASAPTAYFHPATEEGANVRDGKVANYDLNRNGLALDPLYNWVRSTTPSSFNLYKPLNPVPLVVTGVALGAGGVVLYAARASLVPFLQSRVLWGLGSLVAVLVYTSGFMWVKIKQAPYVAAGPNGKVSWIASGFSNQLGLESQVVGGLYGMLALCIVVLTVFIPAQGSPVKQRIGVYLWTAIMIVLFSLLIRLFNMKNGGYPFRLL